jgi:hypothetical protein
LYSSKPRRSAPVIFLSLALACLSVAVVVAADKSAPKVSEDGLELRKQTKQRIVYVKPGASFAQYQSVHILDPYIEFSKDWVKDYNSTQRDLTRKVSDDDLKRAKDQLTKQFNEIFREELTKGGYQIKDAAEPGVLVLRPALVNIRVSAPDLMAPGRSVTYAQSAGEMTLYLELWDATSSAILARVVDAQADPTTMTQRASSVNNRAAATAMLHQWADELVKKLDLARGKSES